MAFTPKPCRKYECWWAKFYNVTHVIVKSQWKHVVAMHWQLHALFCLPLCHGEYAGVRQKPSGPSAGLTQPQHLCQAASTNNYRTLPVATNKARHIRVQYRTVSDSPGVAVLYSLSQRLFFAHYFLVDPHLVPTVTSTEQQWTHSSFFLEFFHCSSVFYCVSKTLTFPDCSLSRSASEVR